MYSFHHSQTTVSQTVLGIQGQIMTRDQASETMTEHLKEFFEEDKIPEV